MIQENYEMGEEDWRDFWGLFVGAIEDEKAVKNGGNLVGVENTIAPGFVSTLMLDSVSEPVSHNIFFLHSGNVCKSGFDEYDSKMVDLLKNLLTEGQKSDKKFPFKKSLLKVHSQVWGNFWQLKAL